MQMLRRKFRIWSFAVVTALVGTGCASISPDVKEPATQLKPIVIRASGYGAYEDPKDRLLQRHRLLAMRASKLDAYRALAEQVYGVSLAGTSTVRDMVLQDDRLTTVVDSLLRGARVVSISETPGGGFETVLELTLDGRFRNCLTSVNYFRYSDECRIQLPESARLSGEDPVIAPGVFRDLSPSASRTLQGAPATLPETLGTDTGGAQSSYYYHLGKGK